jgi:outer membrane protein assembly factor BamB
MSTPAVSGDFVYWGTHDGRFLAANWRKATLAWTYGPRQNQSFSSSAALADGLAVFCGKDGVVEALRLLDGQEVWNFRTSRGVESSPVVVGRRAFIAGGNGRLYALDLANGEKTWEYEAGGRFFASPAVAQHRLVIGNDDGVLYCFGSE